MTQTKDNYKSPYSPHHDSQGQAQQLYADLFYEYEVCHMGTHQTKYRDPQGSNNFNSRAGPTGDYEFHDENNGTAIYTECYPNAHRHYTNNHSTHADGNHEQYTGGVSNKNTGGENSSTTAMNDLGGATNNRVALHGNEARVRSHSNWVNSSDDGIHMQTTSGEGYNYHAGNVCSTFGGAHYSIHQADCGIHVQKDGNLDYRVEQGKMQLQTGQGDLTVKSGGNMTINAQSQITIQVGGSTITIQDGQIQVTSSKITLNGATYLGGTGGQLAGTCGGGCATNVYVN